MPDAFSRARGEDVICYFKAPTDGAPAVPTCPGVIRGEKHVNLHSNPLCQQGLVKCRDTGCKPKYAHLACALAAGGELPPL